MLTNSKLLVIQSNSNYDLTTDTHVRKRSTSFKCRQSLGDFTFT